MEIWILGSEFSKLALQPVEAVKVIPMGILKLLVNLSLGLGSFGALLGLSRAGPLHQCCSGGSLSFPFASRIFLLLGALGRARRGSLWRTDSLGRRIIMDPLHVVMKVPASGEAVSNNGSFAILEETEMGIFSVAMHTMGLTLMAEKTSIGREPDIHTLGHLAVIRAQMRIQVFAV